MFIRRRLVVALVATVILGASCVGNDEVALEPLSGHAGSGEASPTVDPVTDEAGVSGGSGGEGSDTSHSRDIRLEDLPEGMYEGAPPGFGEVPLEELDLPPDEPPPPMQPAPARPPQNAPAPPPPPTSPPTPIPSGGPGGVAGVADYCTLFEQYGTAVAAVNSALESGRADEIGAALKRAAEVHARAAEIGPAASRTDHQDVADGMTGFDALLAQHGYDLDRLFAAAEADPAVGERLAATAADHALERTNQQVLASCGISLT